MFFVYNVPNMNPALGPVKGDKQAVSVYDRDLGNRRTVITTPEEADEFITDRKLVLDDAAKRGWASAIVTTMFGAAAGAGVSAYKEVKEAKRINKLIDPLNEAFKKALNDTKGVLFAKAHVLDLDAFKADQFKIRELFSEENNMFKAIDCKTVAKKAGKYGALVGAGIAAVFGLFIPAMKVESADKKITKEFIEYNK